MNFFDRFRKLTDGTVIDKFYYPAVPGKPEQITGTGKHATVVPATRDLPEGYALLVKGTVKPGGPEYTHTEYVDALTYNNTKVGDRWPLK